MDVKERLKREIWEELKKDIQHNNPKKVSPEPSGPHLIINDSNANNMQRTPAIHNFGFIASNNDTAANVRKNSIIQGEFGINFAQMKEQLILNNSHLV